MAGGERGFRGCDVRVCRDQGAAASARQQRHVDVLRERALHDVVRASAEVRAYDVTSEMTQSCMARSWSIYATVQKAI